VLSGSARLLDFAGLFNRYNRSRSGSEADRLAAAEDWNAVGDDLRSALLEYLSEVDVETLRQLFKARTEQISDESGTQLTLSDVS
jgi:hypothetical protein